MNPGCPFITAASAVHALRNCSTSSGSTVNLLMRMTAPPSTLICSKTVTFGSISISLAIHHSFFQFVWPTFGFVRLSCFQRRREGFQHADGCGDIRGAKALGEAARPGNLSSRRRRVSRSAFVCERDELGALVMGIGSERDDAFAVQLVHRALHGLSREPHVPGEVCHRL